MYYDLEKLLMYFRTSWGSVRLRVLSLFLAGGLGCATSEGVMMAPECPQINMEMIEEMWRGGLDQSPAIEDYLGRVEAYCEAVREVHR